MFQVPGEENLHPITNTETSKTISIQSGDNKIEIPRNLLDEAKDDPLAAFFKIMAARDKCYKTF